MVYWPAVILRSSAAIPGMNQEVRFIVTIPRQASDRVIKFNKTKSIEYPSVEVAFEVIEIPLLRELVYT